MLYSIANVLVKQASLITIENVLFYLTVFQCSTEQVFLKIFCRFLICRTCLACKFNILNNVSPERCETANTTCNRFNIFLILGNITINVLGIEPHSAVHYTLLVIIF